MEQAVKEVEATYGGYMYKACYLGSAMSIADSNPD